MGRYWKRLVSAVLIPALLTWSISAPASGEEGVITGTYQFTATMGGNRQTQDTFVWRDECFAQSSFIGCTHLLELSIQVAQASVSWYGPESDPYRKDSSDNSRNLQAMLEAMGFEDFAVNAWYDSEKYENTIGVGIAHRKIDTPEGSYTLLAVIPRSSGYGMEWAGDFYVGSGDFHEGFREARDEVLRFTKQYIERFGIKGPLKVWTAGHSRGAAVADMAAAFLADGGIGYFGDGVSITPEDIYCYGYATPNMVRPGASREEELSVSGVRGGRYDKDTPGEEYRSAAEGTVDPENEIFRGIRNYPLSYDLIAALPPSLWGFTCYGEVFLLDQYFPVTASDMAAELNALDPSRFRLLEDGGNPEDFLWMSFDLRMLSAVVSDVPDDAGFGDFLDRLIAGLTANIRTNEAYEEEGYEDALMAVSGLIGSLEPFMDSMPEDAAADLIPGLAAAYFSYAAERLQAEGRAESEPEALALAIEDIIGFATGVQEDPDDYTVDDLVARLSRFIADNEDSPMVRSLIEAINNLTAAKGFVRAVLILTLANFISDPEEREALTDGELFLKAVKACAYGPEPGSRAAQVYEDSAAVRRMLYSLLALAMAFRVPGIADAVGTDDSGAYDGSSNFTDYIKVVYSNILRKRDKAGNTRKVYSSLGEAADDLLAEGFGAVLDRLVAAAEEVRGSEYSAYVAGHVQTIKKYISNARGILTYALFYTEGEDFSTADNVRSVYTLLMSKNIISQAHAGEMYLAWARAVNKADVDPGSSRPKL